MKHWKSFSERTKFQILGASRNLQAATMVLVPQAKSDENISNEHPKAEQWLFVVSGSGIARVGKSQKSVCSVPLRAGSLLLIEKGERHQIENTGTAKLRTINFYCPPAYDKNQQPKEAVS
jgi:mannose-6-phosphate isomerase-like protein (cupin superfamily)